MRIAIFKGKMVSETIGRTEWYRYRRGLFKHRANF